MITVLVAASTRSARARLEGLVAAARALRLVSGAPGVPLAQQVEDTRPDVLLVELERGSLDTLLRDHRGIPRGPGIVLLTDDARGRLGDAFRSGVRAVLPRAARPAEVIGAIEAVAAGLLVLYPDDVEALGSRSAPAGHPRPAPGGHPVTPRELEILGMLADGLGNRTIAGRLGISEHTVKFHIAAIFTKLGVATRAEAVTAGIRRGLIPI